MRPAAEHAFNCTDTPAVLEEDLRCFTTLGKYSITKASLTLESLGWRVRKVKKESPKVLTDAK